MSRSCDEVRAWIAEAIDGNLGPAESAGLAQHLGTCQACATAFRAEVASHRRLLEAAAARRLASVTPTRARPLLRRRRAAPSSSAWRVAASLAVAGILAIGAAWALQKPPASAAPGVIVIATLTAADAGAVVIRDGRESPAVVGAPLVDGDRLRSAGRLTIALGGESTTVTADACDLTLERAGQAKRWQLRAGTIVAEVAHQPAGGGLSVLTPQAVAEIVGTRFTLRADAERSRLEVADGRVRFARRDGAGTERMVGAGESASITTIATIDSIAPVAAVVAAPAPAERLVEDHEGALRWTLAADAAPMDVALVAVDGGHALRLAYQPRASDTDNFAQIAHPFAFAKGDRAIRMRLRVISGGAGGSWNLQVRQRDRSCWMLGDGLFSELHPGWNTVEVPLPAAPRRATDDQAPYDPTAVVEVMLSICRDAVTCDCDDLVVVGAPP